MKLKEMPNIREDYKTLEPPSPMIADTSGTT
jgi:hypothetical protein